MKEIKAPETKVSEKNPSRRDFIVKSSMAGAAAMVVGGALSASASKPKASSTRSLTTPITDLLGDYSMFLTDNATTLTKYDLIHLRKHSVRDDSDSSGILHLNVDDLSSIQFSFDIMLQHINGQLYSSNYSQDVVKKINKIEQKRTKQPTGDVTACCCCCPCCTCAAAKVNPKRQV